MTKSIDVQIVSAESEIFKGTAEMVFASGLLGEIGIAPEHAPLITMLRPGEIRLQISDDKEECFYISGGALEVQPYKVIVLADTAVRAHDLDEAAALEAKNRAEKAMADKDANFDYSMIESELAQAAAQLRAIQRLRKNLGK